MWFLFSNFDLCPAVKFKVKLSVWEWCQVDTLDMANRWKAKEAEALKEMRKRVKDVISARRFQFPEGKSREFWPQLLECGHVTISRHNSCWW